MFRGKWTNSPRLNRDESVSRGWKVNFQTASRNRFNIQWWEVPVQQGYAPFPFVSSSFVGVLYTYFPLFLPLPTPSPRQLRTQFLFFLIPPESSCFRKRDSLDEVQERETLSDSSRILYYRSTVIFYRYVNATERERDARERRRRVSPNSVHVSGPNCFAFYAFRFAIPFSFLDVVDHRFSRGYNARFDLVKDHGRVDPWKASVSPKRK